MEKSIILLLCIQYVAKISRSFHYTPKNKQTAVFIEWDEFPKGGSPEFYFLKYQLVNNFAQKNVQKILAEPPKFPKSILTLEENEDYDIIIQSVKYGQILSEKSFQTRGVSARNIKTVATSMSVSFNWSVLSSNDILVSISLNNSSQIMQNVMFYEWDDLKPATLYVFTLEFKQLHLDFINILQRLDIQIETGSCSQGWVALKNSCYRISKESKPWNIAQQYCKLSLSSAHLVDIKNEEEKKFVFSHLRSKNQIIIWTGLNDFKKEGHLTWTDGSSFDLKENEILSFPLLPKNETDCYILQQNSTGSNYFFTGFFCYIPLPYICEYECPLSPQNGTVTYVTPTEIFLHWDAPDPVSFDHYLVVILDAENAKSEEVFVEKPNTSTTIGNLKFFHHYLIYLFSVAERGTLSYFEKPISAITGINPPQKICVKPEDVDEDSIILQWEPPQDSHEVYIQIKSIADTREIRKLFVKDANRCKIDHLIPGMTYDIGMATVMNGNLSELVTIQQTLSENQILFIS